MTEDRKPDLKVVPASAPEDIFNDVDNLRKTALLTVSRRAVAVNMDVLTKVPNNIYFQCHPDPAQRLDASLLIDKEENNVYFVFPSLMTNEVIFPRLRKVTVATAYAWPSGRVFLWTVPFPDERGRTKCWKTARRAFEMSCGLATNLDPPGPRWVQLCWNSERRDYDLAVAENITSTPLWDKDLSFSASLKLAFADKTIDSKDHPYVRQLRGLTD
jgi:hypothetical protein